MRHQITGNAGLTIAAALLLSGCVSDEPPQPRFPSANEAIALAARVNECEAKLASRSDSAKASIANVAEGVMLGCTAERIKARQAFHLRIDDPAVDTDDLKNALEIVEAERARRENSN